VERWTFAEESQVVSPSAITLVEGPTFVICDAGGDIASAGAQGLFVADTRICSHLRLTVDGQAVEALAVSRRSPFSASFVGRASDGALLVFRDLWVSQGLRLDLRIRNLARSPRDVTVRLAIAADLADLFAVKEGRAAPKPAEATRIEGGVAFVDDERGRGLVVRSADAAFVEPEDLCWDITLAPRAEWTACLELGARRGGHDVMPDHRCGETPETAVAARRQEHWESNMPRIESDIPGLASAVTQTGRDLGALRLFDPDHPDDPLVAAGAPWFMTLFGRDSLLTAWMALLIDPAVASATVRALARFQGRRYVPETEEEPGRILHEVRFSRGASLALADGDSYYGSVDATPLFVMLVHEQWRWGTPLHELEPLLPAVDAALDWMQGPGDPDGDGYVEYHRKTEDSLFNQCWKDSHDGMSFADGRLPEAPIAAAEVQAYAYAAWRAGAALARAVGDDRTAAERDARATDLQARFQEDFWLPDAGAVALGLDRHKRPIDAVASNMGHCLWTGIISDVDQARSIARRLVSPELFTGFGVRTLASSMARYNPISYHNGSVWPHDTAICVAGLRRAGFVDEATEIASALLTAAAGTGGRLPELFSGLTVRDMPTPTPYPASCSPQAWATAAPLLLVRALLGLEPDIPEGRLHLDPVLPSGATYLRVTDFPVGGQRVTIEIDHDAVAIRNLPRGLTVVRPRRPDWSTQA
jgi:glycogen debranching enzyme